MALGGGHSPTVPLRRQLHASRSIPLLSMKKLSISDSPSGIAVVILKEVIPDPLPKCFSPLKRYSPSRTVSLAAAIVLPVSPALPPSGTTVPHWQPSTAVWNT